MTDYTAEYAAGNRVDLYIAFHAIGEDATGPRLALGRTPEEARMRGTAALEARGEPTEGCVQVEVILARMRALSALGAPGDTWIQEQLADLTGVPPGVMHPHLGGHAATMARAIDAHATLRGWEYKKHHQG